MAKILRFSSQKVTASFVNTLGGGMSLGRLRVANAEIGDFAGQSIPDCEIGILAVAMRPVEPLLIIIQIVQSARSVS